MVMTHLENSNNLNDSHVSPGRRVRFLYHLAPLLFAGKSAIAVNRTWNSYGKTFGKPGEDWLTTFAPDCVIRVFRLGPVAGQVLVLYYQPGRLQETLYRPDNRKLLAGFGYGPEGNLEADFNHLQTRLKGPFPHEIGIFLGIPACDVAGFVVNKGKNYLLNGYWKVYQNPDQARRVFGEFNQAKQKMNDVIFGRLESVSGDSNIKIIHEPGTLRINYSLEG